MGAVSDSGEQEQEQAAFSRLDALAEDQFRRFGCEHRASVKQEPELEAGSLKARQSYEAGQRRLTTALVYQAWCISPGVSGLVYQACGISIDISVRVYQPW